MLILGNNVYIFWYYQLWDIGHGSLYNYRKSCGILKANEDFFKENILKLGTFPDDFTPFIRAIKVMIELNSKHKDRCHCNDPRSSIPFVIPSTSLLKKENIRFNGK